MKSGGGNRAESVIHRYTQDDCVKVRMYLDHLKVVLHEVCLPDGIMKRKDSTRENLFRVEFIRVVYLSFLIGIKKDKVKGSFPWSLWNEGGCPESRPGSLQDHSLSFWAQDLRNEISCSFCSAVRDSNSIPHRLGINRMVRNSYSAGIWRGIS